jgi:hypothetical protein
VLEEVRPGMSNLKLTLQNKVGRVNASKFLPKTSSFLKLTPKFNHDVVEPMKNHGQSYHYRIIELSHFKSNPHYRYLKISSGIETKRPFKSGSKLIERFLVWISCSDLIRIRGFANQIFVFLEVFYTIPETLEITKGKLH